MAGCRPWTKKVFKERISKFPGEWFLVEDPQKLTPQAVGRLAPCRLFFLHWSWKIPSSILRRYECVGFHMTDLPFGRGGSPLQNLIARGIRQTRMTAFRMNGQIDAGPIYLKENLSLKGSAEEIYLRASRKAAAMIREMIRRSICPVSQRGRVIEFIRRRPGESRIACLSTLARLYDFIRMLDATGYPRAFLEAQGFRFEFSEAMACQGHLEAKVRIFSAEERNSCRS